MEYLQIQLFLAASAASLVGPKQERRNGMWQRRQVRGSILRVMVRLLLLYLGDRRVVSNRGGRHQTEVQEKARQDRKECVSYFCLMVN